MTVRTISFPLKKGCRAKCSNQKAPKPFNPPKLQGEKKRINPNYSNYSIIQLPSPPFKNISPQLPSPRHRRRLAPGGGGIGTAPAELVVSCEGPDGALPGDVAHHGGSHGDAQVGKTSVSTEKERLGGWEKTRKRFICTDVCMKTCIYAYKCTFDVHR